MLRPLLSKANFVSSLMLVAMLWTQATWAAPMCRGVLVGLVSESAATEIVDSLTRLRLFLDIEKGRGNSSSSTKRMDRDYRAKLQEAAKAMGLESSILSEKIKARIPTIQNKSKNIEEARRVEKAKFEVTKFKMNLASEIPSKNVVYNNIVSFLPEIGSVIEMSRDGLVTLRNIITQKEVVIAKDVVHISSAADRKSIVILDEQGILHFFDLKSLTETRALRLKLGRLKINSKANPIWSVNLNPNKNKVAFGINAQIYVFDLITGSLIARQKLLPKIQVHLKFLNDNELFYAQGAELGVFDLATRKIILKEAIVDSRWVRSVEFTDDLKFALISYVGSGSSPFHSLNLDLNGFILSMNSVVENAGVRASGVPGRPDLIAASFGSGEETGVFSHRDFSRIFDFDGKYDSGANRSIDQMVFSSDGNSVLVDYYDGKLQMQRSDIWEYDGK